MRCRLKNRRNEEGSTLVVALVIGAVIGVILAGYLDLIGSRYKATMRSQCWTGCIPVVEAGIEEAMTHLNLEQGIPTANGWNTALVGPVLVNSKQRVLADGSYYTVSIQGVDTRGPVIYSTGFVPSPIYRSTYVSRIVRVRGTNSPLINVAFAAIGSVDMNGNGLMANSFNSNDPWLTNFQYNAAYTYSNGSVASVYGPVDFGNHSINGNLYLGPGVSGVGVGTNQVNGNVYSDFNVSYPPASLPTNAVWVPAVGVGSGSGKTYTFVAPGDYIVDDSANIVVASGVHVRLKITTTSFDPTSIRLLRDTNGVNSGSIEMYQLAGEMTLSGNSITFGDRARDFMYFGLPGVTSVTYGGTTSFIGVIYSPDADFKLNGGGSNVGFLGSSISKTIEMNGHYDFHFDEDLLTYGPSRPFVATSWEEI